MAKKDNDTFKIGGVLAVIGIVIYWGNVIFKNVGSSSSKKDLSSQARPFLAGSVSVCTSDDGKVINQLYIPAWVDSDLTWGGFTANKIKRSDTMYHATGIWEGYTFTFVLNRRSGRYVHNVDAPSNLLSSNLATTTGTCVE